MGDPGGVSGGDRIGGLVGTDALREKEQLFDAREGRRKRRPHV